MTQYLHESEMTSRCSYAVPRHRTPDISTGLPRHTVPSIVPGVRQRAVRGHKTVYRDPATPSRQITAAMQPCKILQHVTLHRMINTKTKTVFKSFVCGRRKMQKILCAKNFKVRNFRYYIFIPNLSSSHCRASHGARAGSRS